MVHFPDIWIARYMILCSEKKFGKFSCLNELINIIKNQIGEINNLDIFQFSVFSTLFKIFFNGAYNRI
jgi:hypothetical protein